MKRILLSLAVISAGIHAAKAQISLNNVPSNASVVIKYSGENFAKNVPVKKLDAYNFVKNSLFKALRIDSLTSLEGTGIDFEKDAYQYAVLEDSAMSFVSMLNIKNVQQFLQLVQGSYQAEMRPVKKNGYEFLSMSKDTYLGWNEKQAILVYTNYKSKKNYYDYPVAADSAMVVVDSVATNMDNEMPTPPVVKKPTTKKPQPGRKKGAAVKPGKKGVQKRSPKKKVEAPEEIVIDDVAEYHMSYEDSVENARRDAWYEEQNKYAAVQQKSIADSIINAVFNTKTASIETELSYKKIVDPAAHVSLWFNYDNMMNLYWASIFSGFGKITHNIFQPKKMLDRQDDGFRSGMNIYFEKDKMRIDQKMYSPDEKMTALGKELYNTKQSNALAGFINPDNIACMSASINTEAMANYYYTLIRRYLTNNPYTNEYSDMVDVYMDLVEIIIDEKAIAELMPGNMVMVLHDMKTKTVSYTDYVYDDNFKATEVKKTKQELSPNFTFVMETKKDAFLQKIAKLPLRFAEKEHFNYKEKGGYYELAFNDTDTLQKRMGEGADTLSPVADKYPISSLYFMVKDGKAIITTSKEVIDMTLKNTGYSLDADTKNGVLNNNVFLKINSKKLIEQINPELSTDLSKKISAYLQENIGDLKMQGGLKDGMMQATTTMSITGNNTNSLEFFFNMIDAINDIIEKDKLERDKKID